MNNLPHQAQVPAHKVAWAERRTNEEVQGMSTQDVAAARFMPTAGRPTPAEILGFAVRKRRQNNGDAWWETVTDYLPAPWRPAQAIVAFGMRTMPKPSR